MTSLRPWFCSPRVIVALALGVYVRAQEICCSAAQDGDTPREIPSGSVAAANKLPALQVPRWEMQEFVSVSPTHVPNPFRDAALVGEFISPTGKTNVADGFYDGDDTWRLRFAPDEEGEWSYVLRGEGVEILQRGTLRCTPPRGHGFIRLHPENPYAFAHADGTPFFPMGDTCYGLFDDTPITPALRDEYLKVRRSQHFNFVRMTVGHSEAQAARDPAFWAWGGTIEKPDLDRFNPGFFRRFDGLIAQLRAGGMNVELILLNFYRRPFTDTRQWTPARERQWLRYVVARYGAFDNIFLWTLANEYETHPDGKYRLDFPDDVEWAKATARFIKANDSIGHPITVHPVISSSRQGDSPRSPIDPPWRIGEFFGEDQAIDVLSQQTGQSGDGVFWDDTLQCWRGDSATLVASVQADRRFHKPVLNTESGYEYLRGQPSSKRQVHHTDKVRHSAWRIVCAGGYFAAGFNGTIGHSDAWNRLDPPHHYTFIVKDEGAANQLSALYSFWAALPFWRMQPFDGVTGEAIALAEAGKVYVAYLTRGGRTVLDLTQAPGVFSARWFNPRTGQFGETFRLAGEGKRSFEAPDAEDWVVQLTRVSSSAASSLREASAGLFTIGVGINDRIPERPKDWPMLLEQFSTVTPENCLKPDPLQVAEGKFNFGRADAFVSFAASNHLQVIGHCLVWAKDDRTPPWLFRDGANSASGELLLERMKTHVETVVGRYRGRIAAWDVVNEALDDGTNFLRPSGWTAACGDEFLVKAFQIAHAADPQALLIYNDYNNELPDKRAKLVRLVRLLRERNAPIHAIGLQGHYEIDRLPLHEIEATLVAMRELGVKVVISELDMDVIPRGRWWAEGGKHRDELSKLDPYRNGCPPDVLERQAEQYAQLFRLLRKHADVIARVSFWNLHDGQSWLNYFPWIRVNHPLLFDREGKPKPAFEAVIKALNP